MIRHCGLAALFTFLTAVPCAFAQEAPLTGEAAFGDWKADRPGSMRQFKPGDMPKPFITKSAANRPDKVSMADQTKPLVPQGFEVEMIASGIGNPRAARVAPNGDLFVADSSASQIRLYRLAEGGGAPVEDTVFARGLTRPYGIAFYPPDKPQWVYVANTDSVVRFPYKDGDLSASGEAETIVEELPSGGHWTRDIAFSQDGKTLYVSVGSLSNLGSGMDATPPDGLEAWVAKTAPGAAWGDEELRAGVLAFDPDGKNRRVFATGLRNCSGMAVQPDNGALWCAVNERDGLGDNVPFEFATTVKENGFYGWPWFYVGSNEEPRRKGERPDLANKVTVPDVLIQPHSAPLGITFHDGTGFPPGYAGSAFVALHGSWNRGVRTGYKVVRLPFKDGKPTGAYEDFMTGFVLSDDEVWGRPVGVAVARDGSLIVTEDGSGTIWRVTWQSSRS